MHVPLEACCKNGTFTPKTVFVFKRGKTTVDKHFIRELQNCLIDE